MFQKWRQQQMATLHQLNGGAWRSGCDAGEHLRRPGPGAIDQRLAAYGMRLSLLGKFNLAALGVQLRRRKFSGNADRKSTRLNSSHVAISYAVFCLKKKN